MSAVPPSRLRVVNDRPIDPRGRHVLYWMIASRRTRWSFALERAVEIARETGRPLVVLEALGCRHRFASDRLHRFVLDGMADNARALEGSGVLYHPYVEPAKGAGRGLLAALAERACAVVTDDHPGFMLPTLVRAAARRIGARLEAVDGNGLLPMRAADRAFPTAFAFRRFLQRNLPAHLEELPAANPLARARLPAAAPLPPELLRRWPPASDALLAGDPAALASLPIDHGVRPAELRGGSRAAGKALARFLDDRLARYAEQRNQPEADAASGLSPWLHFGHLSAHQVFAELAERQGWSPPDLARSATGGREGWWGMGRSAEAFLDQLVTWRELGFNMCCHREGHDRYESLPPWALATLEAHARDPRPHLYALERLAAGSTHDRLWNAAQTQLLREGRIHNYLRMLWGKKILEWSASPREALEAMTELNDRYALDGRDPNSGSGIFWCLGRYDRPWGPERPILGTVRYMSSENTARKVRVRGYVERYTVAGGSARG